VKVIKGSASPIFGEVYTYSDYMTIEINNSWMTEKPGFRLEP